MTVETPIGQYAPDFELPGVDGTVHHLTQYLVDSKAIGVVVMGNYCPYVRQSLPYLKHLQTQLVPQGVTLVGINGNDTTADEDESVAGMKQFAQTHQLNFPYLRDKTQDVLRTFNAMMTPDIFLLDQRGIVCYAGAIALNLGTEPLPPALIGSPNAMLEVAIAQLLSGESITTPYTEVSGTPIKWRT
ncbi:MAG: redoxin domain-containing protein [Leptolyngbyaceae bacterium]|nr:redoxin domain-containing protein [Leptolyngbyaceae bacterium]